MHPTIHNTTYVIATFKNPVLWAIDGSETWLLNPCRRYVMNADMLEPFSAHIDTITDLRSASKYKPLRRGENIVGKRVLVERYRHRGIGDLLFLTGPFAYLKHITGGNTTLDVYALAERGAIYEDNPDISSRTPLSGPIHYDDFDFYAAHWLVEVATEYDESPDQSNVYDALYRSIDVDPDTVDPRFKRPTMSLSSSDQRALDMWMWATHHDTKVDFRSTPYSVVAPLTHASLRSLPYQTWLEVIDNLCKKTAVIVLGAPRDGLTPESGMSVAQFRNVLDQMRHSGRPVFDFLGKTPLRLSASIVSKARAVACLDSGLLYVAQAFRTPAVSVWGTHAPHTRIGYDPEYMDAAVYSSDLCPAAPCYAYSRFPTHKCPRGENQTICEALAGIHPHDIMKKLSKYV